MKFTIIYTLYSLVCIGVIMSAFAFWMNSIISNEWLYAIYIITIINFLACSWIAGKSQGLY